MKIESFMMLLLMVFANLYSKAQIKSFVIDSSKFKMELLPILDTIYKDDQSYRIQLSNLKKNNAPAEEITSVSKLIVKKDSLNLIKVSKIINKYGWLGPQDIGMDGSQALFLVIQHADLKTQKQFYAIVKKAEQEGKTLSSNLAILEDRIAMREGRNQLYGSQGFKDKTTNKNYIYPILDPDKLDERRKSMGMPPMNTYVADWNLENYKKELPKIIQIVEQQNIR